MAVSSPITNRRKKNKMHKQFNSGRDQVTRNLNNDSSNRNGITSWKSEGRQEVYRSKLFQALNQVRQGSGTSLLSAPLRGRAVREAADRVLAMAAKGRTRWSRAILTNKLEHKLMKSNLRRRGIIATARKNSQSKKARSGILRLKSKVLPAVQRKTRDLGRLVPGCRKLPFPVVLEEVTDYIEALEMQVKAMAAIANILSVGSSSGTSYGAGAANLNQHS